MHYVADDRRLVSHYSGLIAAEPAVATTWAELARAHITPCYKVISLRNILKKLYFRCVGSVMVAG